MDRDDRPAACAVAHARALVLNCVPSERCSFVQPPFWHRCAFAELPLPRPAVATVPDSATVNAAAVTNEMDVRICCLRVV